MPEEIFLPDDIDRKNNGNKPSKEHELLKELRGNVDDPNNESGPKNIDPDVIAVERKDEQKRFEEMIQS